MADFPRLDRLAMTDEDWRRYCEEKGHPPTWRPHEGRKREAPKDKE